MVIQRFYNVITISAIADCLKKAILLSCILFRHVVVYISLFQMHWLEYTRQYALTFTITNFSFFIFNWIFLNAKLKLVSIRQFTKSNLFKYLKLGQLVFKHEQKHKTSISVCIELQR